MPDNAVYVGRPTKWGNPFRVGGNEPSGDVITVGRAFELFSVLLDFEMDHIQLCGRDETRRRLKEDYESKGITVGVRMRVMALTIEELRGKDLACWCPLDSPCHADVLLELANRVTAEAGEQS